jgi:preprotein translocase subunit SecG
MTLANYITLGSGVLLIILILLQTRGASLGAGLGGGGEVNTVRRGSEKSLHNITIFLVVVFSLSLLANIVQI